jgi:hypothetical protein
VRRRAHWIAIVGTIVALTAASGASAWHYTFQNLFDPQGSAFGDWHAAAKKCGPGGKLGTYKYRSVVIASAQSFELEFEINAKLSVRDSWRKLRQVEVDYTATNYPEDLAQEAAVGIEEFHETVETKYKDPNKLRVRHGSMTILGNEVVAPGASKTKFKPKPGC